MSESNTNANDANDANGAEGRPLNLPMPSTVTHADGTMTISAPNGASITTQLDGSIALNYQHVKSVGIQDIMGIETHNITHILGMAAHFVKFYSSAELRFSYNERGQLIELTFSGLNAKLNEQGHVMFSLCEAGASSQVEFEVTVPGVQA